MMLEFVSSILLDFTTIYKAGVRRFYRKYPRYNFAVGSHPGGWLIACGYQPKVGRMRESNPRFTYKTFVISIT
jgi:hypothetical protein